MLYYDRIDRSQEIEPTKNSKSKECIIWHYWFLNHGFKFQDSVCNGCHDLSILCLNIIDITIITVKNVNYRCIIQKISKSEVMNLLESAVLEKREHI